MRRKRLLWQLFPSYLFIILLSLTAITWYFAQALHDFHHTQSARDLEARARLIQDSIQKPLQKGNYVEVDSICKRLGKETATRITVIDPNGNVLGESNENPEQMENHANRPEIRMALKGDVGISTRYSTTIHQEMKYVAIPMRQNHQITGVIRTSYPLAKIEQTIGNFFFQIGLAGLIIALISAAVSLINSRRITRPLENMKAGAELYAHGNLDHRLELSNTREISALAEAMNQMAIQLDERIRFIQQQRNEHEAILSSMVEGVVAVDQRENIISINQAAAQMFEFLPFNVHGQNIQEVVKNDELYQIVSDSLKSDKPIEGEIVLRDHTERYIQTNGSALLDAEGKSVGAVIVFNDTTHLRRLEKLRSDFVANVSHELKTPVTSIKGFVETLLDGAMNNPDDSVRFLNIVAKQTDRLQSIIEDLLSLSHIEQESGNAKVALKEEPIQNVLQMAIDDCRENSATKQIQIHLSCPDIIIAEINAPLLEQAIVNLIDNAIKYSEPGKNIHVQACKTDSEIRIEVQDEGCGIAEEHLDRIFERFYRVDKARSREMGGTGLGLSIVKHIAKTHHGIVSVESTPQIGSTFTIHLPNTINTQR